MNVTFLDQFLGWTSGRANVADKKNKTSLAIAAEMFKRVGLTSTISLKGQEAGTALEVATEQFLARELPRIRNDRDWQVRRNRPISDFAQYAHLKKVDDLISADASGTLASELGRDYLVAPDVTVGLAIVSAAESLLHASVSCKLTIRSDRVQNIRHEGVILTRHRRGRQPHIVVVTAEPLPTRIASIARGTGEVDAVYHVALAELLDATELVGTPLQKRTLAELVDQNRLLPLEALVQVLGV
ncbi:MAG: restriction endonuclease [Dehalococcoidia bacterium]|jgi:hypothetical protein|nr:restriction endonuclease [Dehalococcoidia bacterium]